MRYSGVCHAVLYIYIYRACYGLEAKRGLRAKLVLYCTEVVPKHLPLVAMSVARPDTINELSRS